MKFEHGSEIKITSIGIAKIKFKTRQLLSNDKKNYKNANIIITITPYQKILSKLKQLPTFKNGLYIDGFDTRTFSHVLNFEKNVE